MMSVIHRHIFSEKAIWHLLLQCDPIFWMRYLSKVAGD